MVRRRPLIVGLVLIQLTAAGLILVLLLNAEQPEEGAAISLAAWHRELILLFAGASLLATFWRGQALAPVVCTLVSTRSVARIGGRS
jgi:hypothetical protein